MIWIWWKYSAVFTVLFVQSKSVFEFRYIKSKLFLFQGDVSEEIRYKTNHLHKERESQRKMSEKQEFSKREYKND